MMNYLIYQQLVCAFPFETERNEKNFEEMHVFFLIHFCALHWKTSTLRHQNMSCLT